MLPKTTIHVISHSPKHLEMEKKKGETRRLFILFRFTTLCLSCTFHYKCDQKSFLSFFIYWDENDSLVVFPPPLKKKINLFFRFITLATKWSWWESGSHNLEHLVKKLNIIKDYKFVTDLYSQPAYRNPSYEPDLSCISPSICCRSFSPEPGGR